MGAKSLMRSPPWSWIVKSFATTEAVYRWSWYVIKVGIEKGVLVSPWRIQQMIPYWRQTRSCWVKHECVWQFEGVIEENIQERILVPRCWNGNVKRISICCWNSSCGSCWNTDGSVKHLSWLQGLLLDFQLFFYHWDHVFEWVDVHSSLNLLEDQY
jgi:hypothetical protein